MDANPHRPLSPTGAYVQDDGLKQLVKQLFWMLVAGLAESDGLGPAAREFVTVLRLTQDEREIALTLVSPYQESLSLIRRASSGDLAGPEGDRIMERVSSLEVHHRYAIVEAVLLPVVVSYDPGAQRVLLINQNHFANPDQFLSPWLCRTTSGFLDFIGAQHIAMELHHRKKIMVSDLEAMMNQGLDEWIRWLFYAMETGTLFETDRLLVNKANPEQYVYEYFGEQS